MFNRIINIICKKNQRASGFITIAVISIVGFAYFLFDRIINVCLIHNAYSKNFLITVQSKQLIYSTLQIAMLKMLELETGIEENTEEIIEGITIKTEETPSEISIDDRLRSFYNGLIPMLNQWQTFDLKEDVDGINANIQYLISCEEGKFNFNEIFDFEQKKIKQPFVDLIKEAKTKPNKNSKTENVEEESVDKILLKAIENKQNQFLDASEIPTSENIKYFYEPVITKKSKKVVDAKVDEKKDYDPNNIIYLADIFSNEVKKSSINPLVLSNSILSMLGIDTSKINRSSKTFKKKIRNLTNDLTFQTPNWSALSPKLLELFILDEIDAQDAQSSSKVTNQGFSENLLKFTNNLTKNIEPTIFSVFCCIEYKGIIKKALAIIRREEIQKKYKLPEKSNNTDDPLKNEKPKEKNNATLLKRCFFVPRGFEIIKFYWI